MFLDLLVIAVSYVLTYIFRDQLIYFGLEELAGFDVYFPYLVVVLIVWMILLRLFRNYSYLHARTRVSLFRIYINLIPVQAVGLAVVAGILFFLRDTQISRTFLILFSVVNYFMLAGAKQAFLLYFYRLQRGDRYTRNALVIGHRRAVNQFVETARNTPELLFKITVEEDFVRRADEQLSQEERHELFDDILKYVSRNVVDEVVLAYNDLRLADLTPLVSGCNHMGLMVNVVMDFSELDHIKSEIDSIGPFNIVSFQAYDFSPVQRFFKHLIDYILGGIGTFLFLLMLPLVALAIKIDAPGPVFFVQPRKGKNGRDFQLIKFRTMYVDAEERKQELMDQNEMKGHMFKMKDDPRITRVGAFLRKSSLDEFPQFINVLKGDMSIVGTRPPTAAEYQAYEAHHRRRLSVQPGITGMWQVSGRNRIDDFEEVVKLDTWYIDHWSIWLDLRIIGKTFLVLASGR